MTAELRTQKPATAGVGRAARTLIAATAISALGNSMYIGAAALLVLELTRHPGSVPLIAICGGLPAIVLAPLVPRAINRYGANRVAVVADLVSAAAACGYPVLVLLSLGSHAEIVYVQELIIGSAAAFYSTSARILVTALSASSASVLVRINGYSIATNQIAGVIGWGLGALVLAVSSAATAMMINALSFFVSAVMQWWVRAELRLAQRRAEEAERQAQQEDPEQETAAPAHQGRLAYAWPVLAVAVLIVVFTTTQRLWLSNFPAVLELVLGKPDWTLGVANVAYSTGAIIAGITIAGRVGNPAVRLAVMVICSFYAFCAVVTFASPLPLMLALYCVVGIASIGVVLAQSRLQLDLPVTRQSRFFARLLAVQNAANLVFLALWIPMLRLTDPRTLIVITLTIAAVITVLLGVSTNDRRAEHVRQ